MDLEKFEFTTDKFLSLLILIGMILAERKIAWTNKRIDLTNERLLYLTQTILPLLERLAGMKKKDSPLWSVEDYSKRNDDGDS